MAPSNDPDGSGQRSPEVVRWNEIPSTRWTLVGRAGGRPADAAGAADARGAMDELLRLYLPVLRGHLLSTLRLAPDRTDDLLQGFLADRVVERNLIAQADASRGRFRRFLLTALNRYVTDAHRRESAAKRQPAAGAPLSMDGLIEQRDAGPTAAEQFDRLWANEVIAEVIRRTCETCKTNGRADLWTVLEARILQPVTAGIAPTPHEDLARQLGLPDAAHAANLLATAKQLFARVFRDVVGEYVASHCMSDADALARAVDEETKEIWAVYAARSG